KRKGPRTGEPWGEGRASSTRMSGPSSSRHARPSNTPPASRGGAWAAADWSRTSQAARRRSTRSGTASRPTSRAPDGARPGGRASLRGPRRCHGGLLCSGMAIPPPFRERLRGVPSQILLVTAGETNGQEKKRRASKHGKLGQVRGRWRRDGHPKEADGVQVTVRTFAALAEAVGQRTLTLDLPPDATVQEAWRQLVAVCPPIERFERRLLVAVNLSYATWQTRLAEGDEVAFMPPVSGGSPGVEANTSFEITDQPLSADALIAKVGNPRAGGVALFAGVVREFTGERRTVSLEYEAYREMAVQEMARIGREVANRWPDVRLAITHRVGALGIGEASVMVAAAAPHRDSAFSAARYAIDRL